MFVECALNSCSPSSAKLMVVKKGQMKETKKKKLTETLSKRLKQSVTGKKLKDELNDSEMLPLLSDTGGKNVGIKNICKKKQTKEQRTSDDCDGASPGLPVCRSRSKDPLFPGSRRLDEKRKKQIEARKLRRQRHKVCSFLQNGDGEDLIFL